MSRPNRSTAEIFALEALTWLVGREDLLSIFLGSSGLSRDDLRDRAGDTELLVAVLDFLLMDDEWIRAFCDDKGHDYAAVMSARDALPGGGDMHWT